MALYKFRIIVIVIIIIIITSLMNACCLCLLALNDTSLGCFSGDVCALASKNRSTPNGKKANIVECDQARQVPARVTLT